MGVDPIELLKSLPRPERDPKADDLDKSRGFNRVFEMPEFSDDLFREWENLPPIEISELPEVAFEVLAWYQPLSNYGEKSWGIYFDVAKMNAHAQLIYRACKAVRPAILPSTVVRAVWDEVMRHEREHAVQELTLAVMVEMGLHPATDANSVYTKSKDLMEAIATHFQQTDAIYRKPSSNVSDRNFVRHITSKARKPLGYRDWDLIDIDQATKDAYSSALWAESALEIAASVRKRVRNPSARTYIDIPIYVM